MSQATYYPNSTDCAAWKGWHTARPPVALADLQDSAYSAIGDPSELDKVSADDSSYVDSPSGDYEGHEPKFKVGVSGVTWLDLTVKVTEQTDGDTPFYLYLWDFNTTAWVQVDYELMGVPNTTITLTASVAVGNYLSGGLVYAAVQSGQFGRNVRNYFDRLIVTHDDHEGAPADLSHAHTLDATVGAWGWAGSPAELNHGQVLDAPAVTQAHVASPDDLAHAHSLDNAVEGSITASPDDLAHGHTLDAVAGSVSHAATPADLAHGHQLDSVDGVVVHIGASADLQHAHSLDSPAISQQHTASPDDLAHGHGLDAGAGFPEVHLYVDLLADGTRHLSWTETGTVSLIVDGALYAETADGYMDLPAEFVARGILIGYEDDVPDPLPTPRDEVDLTITGDDGAIHTIERRVDAGAWAEVAGILAAEYRDGPLDDGAYDWRVTDEDEEGDTATSSEASATIESYPDAPSGIDYTWVAGTKTLTMSWDASGSADLASYPVRSNAGSGVLDLTDTPVQDTGALSYEQVFTTETGVYLFMVRGKDTDGYEEPGLTQLLQLAFVAGVLQAIPTEPSLVRAEAVADGKIKVSYLYRPWMETDGPGAAYEGRIYYDNGTGTVSYASPLATVAMNGPTAETEYEWTSGVLVDDTEYRFVVRIGTAAHPAGIETQGKAEVYATADADQPTTPTLAVQVV